MSTPITPEILEQALSQYFGIAPEEVKTTFEQLTATVATVNEIQPLVVSQWREKETAKLKEAWGDEFQPVYDTLVNEVFPKLPPEEQAKWNNADGLKFLAEQHRSTIEARITSNKEGTPDPSTVPTPSAQGQNNQGSIAPANSQAASGVGASSAPSFKQSQLLSMSPEEWAQNESAIQQAYASGSVEMDVE